MENCYKLVETHMDLVNKKARQLMKKNENYDWLTEDDLVNAGYEALVAAACAYDASREASFKTFAEVCIKNAMLAEIRNMFPVKVTDKEVSRSLVRDDVAESTIKQKEQTRLMCSWESEHRYQIELLQEAMALLNPDEQWLLRCYYGFEGEPMTLQGVANLLSVSPQAVHKRLNRVHDKLRKLVMDSSPSFRLCA